MKGLFLILLFANAAFFIFHHFYQDKTAIDSASAINLGPGEGGIILLAELNDGAVATTEVVIDKTQAKKIEQADTIEGTESLQPPAAILESCYEVRGFKENNAAESNLNTLIKSGFIGGVVELPRQELSSFWVISRQYASQAEAVKLLRKMRKAKIDSYVIESGDNKNSISVGLFKSKKHAEARKKAINAMGFSVELKANYRTVTEYMLELSYRGIQQAPSLQQIITNPDNSEIKVEEKKCPEKPINM